jgi:exosome complex RNA-binding protein Csl4
MQKVEDSFQVGDLVVSRVVSREPGKLGNYARPGIIVAAAETETKQLVKVHFFHSKKTKTVMANHNEVRKINSNDLPCEFRQQAAHIIAKLLCGMEI